VIATTSSVEKAERLKQLGADQVINYREQTLWGEAARTLTNGVGVDCVVEVGGPGTMAQSLRAVRAGGEIASIGFLDAVGVGIDFFALFGSGANFRHISVGSREGLHDVARAIATAGIRPVIDRVFDFEAAHDAYARLESGRHLGKVVICTPVQAQASSSFRQYSY
jgi:NADPH:quinone reductase-like Zn-dependent oxidoreductase